MDSFHEEAIFGLVLGTSLLLFFAFIFVFAVFQSQKKQLKNRFEKNQMQKIFEASILKAQIEVQNETLHNVGQELHDNIGQLLTVARISMNMLEDDADLPSPFKNKIQETSDIINQSILEVRLLTKSLDGSFVKNFGLLESIRNEVTRVNKTKRFLVSLQIDGDPFSLEFKKEIVLFRVLQESLNNAIKHSGARHIDFIFEFGLAELSVTVKDDGKGFKPEDVLQRNITDSGAGLKNIVERVKLIGGTIAFTSSQGKGTAISILLPQEIYIP